MDEHCETPTYSFSEQMDSTSTNVLAGSQSESHGSTLADVPLPYSNKTPVCLYNEDTKAKILTMASEPDEQHTLPFLKRIQLPGTHGSIVRATGQVDNGAMRNCISKRRWDAYGHCLSALSPTTTRISIANNTEIVPIGRWFREITICGIGAYSWFEIFESHGAFDVILGKPRLHQLKAIHDYGNDQLQIPQGDSFAVIPNSLLAPSSDSPVQTGSDTTRNDIRYPRFRVRKRPVFKTCRQSTIPLGI